MGRDAFFDRVAAAKRNLRIGSQGAWFRGIKKRTYELKPSYLRYPRLDGREHNLMARFVRQGSRYLDTQDKWERLAFMQHYGIPTKLMDWTVGLTAAIYFALAYDTSSMEDLDRPHIWILNPFRLNRRSVKKGVIFDNMDEAPEYTPERISSKQWKFDLPIAITVAWRDRRMEHQQGTFTYHGKFPEPLDELAPDCTTKIEIEPNEIEDLLVLLRDVGYTHHRMLQDPDSLGRDLKEQALETGVLWGKAPRVAVFRNKKRSN